MRRIFEIIIGMPHACAVSLCRVSVVFVFGYSTSNLYGVDPKRGKERKREREEKKRMTTKLKTGMSHVSVVFHFVLRRKFLKVGGWWNTHNPQQTTTANKQQATSNKQEATDT
jgi:hypothetical protein